MADNISQFISAGFRYAFALRMGSDGLPVDVDGTLVAGAAGVSARKIIGVKTSDIQLVQPDTVPVTGDDTTLGQFIFAPSGTPAFTLQAGVSDLTLESYSQGTSVVNKGTHSFSGLQPTDPVYPDWGLFFMREAKSQASGSVGTSMWEGMYLVGQMVPGGATPISEREAAAQQFRINGTIFDRYIWGETFRNDEEGTEGFGLSRVTADNRIWCHVFKGDGATTVFGPLAYTPVSSGIGTDNIVAVDRVPRTSGVSLDTTTRMLTITPAPATDKIVVVWYQFS